MEVSAVASRSSRGLVILQMVQRPQLAPMRQSCNALVLGLEKHIYNVYSIFFFVCIHTHIQYVSYMDIYIYISIYLLYVYIYIYILYVYIYIYVLHIVYIYIYIVYSVNRRFSPICMCSLLIQEWSVLNHNDKRRCTASALAIIFSGDLQWYLSQRGGSSDPLAVEG